MSQTNKNKSGEAAKAYDVILVFITAFAAPLIAHICDLTMGAENNPLSSEKLLCAYFALIATFVIYEFLLSYYKRTRLWKMGWRFGCSDALIVSLYIVVATIAIGYYNSLLGAMFILAILLLFIAILIFKPDRVSLNSRRMVFFALAVSVLTPFIYINIFGTGLLDKPTNLVWFWFAQFIVCFLFDGIFVLIQRHINKGRQNQQNQKSGLKIN